MPSVSFSARSLSPWLLRALSVAALAAALAPARLAAADAPRTNYKLAEKFSAEKLRPLSYDTSVFPNWIGKTDEFWYSFRMPAGTQYWRVDPAKKTKKPLFDREKLAAQLGEISRKPVNAAVPPISRGQVSADGKTFTFVSGEMLYRYDLAAGTLTQQGRAPARPAGFGAGAAGGRGGRFRRNDGEREDTRGRNTDTTVRDRTRGPGAGGRNRQVKVYAPDRKAYFYVDKFNLYLAEEGGKTPAPVQLSKDGAEDYVFMVGLQGQGGRGGRGAALGGEAPRRPSPWSPDSKHFFTTRRDSRGVQELYLVSSLANPRPALTKYKYPMPGEEKIPKGELYVGSRESKVLRRVPVKWRDESYSNPHWGKTPGELRFLRTDRLLRNCELCAMDVNTGACKTLVREGFENAPVFEQPPRYLEETGEMVWWSERSGWGHYYLYDKQGKLKNPITSGAWRASRIVALDEKKRVLYFQGNAREPGENVYYEHLYAVNLDGSHLRLLNPGDATHTAVLSPSRQFVVDNASRVDRAPEVVLRSAAGAKVMDLEKADLARLKEYGWKPPETFVVKAADGVTDLYGNLWKPFDFNPNRKYPIIAHVYPGPQTEGVTYTFSAYSTNMQLAQLGFIVVQVGHRGGAPTRSKAYGSYGYFNLRDYGLADKKAAIEALAVRHPWIDVQKVGIFGHSGGGFMSAAALLQKPYNEFFKVAVASAGNHDNNIYNNQWSERYHGLKEVLVAKADAGKAATTNTATQDRTRGRRRRGESGPAAPPPTKKAAKDAKAGAKAPPAAPPATKFEIKVPTNAELAANLKGRLLLVHGEVDNNVHPANTMRLVDALIKANKRFDMLILPGKTHGFADYQPYFTQRMFEFFAEHLQGDRRKGADILDKGD
jgi:dienelactone hydrolase